MRKSPRSGIDFSITVSGGWYKIEDAKRDEFVVFRPPEFVQVCRLARLPPPKLEAPLVSVRPPIGSGSPTILTAGQDRTDRSGHSPQRPSSVVPLSELVALRFGTCERW